MDENEPLVCSDCGMESTEETAEESMLSGWEEGEFGPRCPGCVAENQATSGSQGLAAVGEALNLEKVRDAKPMAIEFVAVNASELDNDNVVSSGVIRPKRGRPPKKAKK